MWVAKCTGTTEYHTNFHFQIKDKILLYALQMHVSIVPVYVGMSGKQ